MKIEVEDMKHIEMTTLLFKEKKDERTIRIRLPKDYHQKKTSYPVLYMHDGQNLFDDSIAYGGHSWGIDDVLKSHNLDDLIVVGIDNSKDRMFEYSPWKSSPMVAKITYVETGGEGDLYADFVVNTVKPYIETTYRVKKGYENTMIAGSSMGAYISAYIAAKFPNLFSIVGIFSLASWFNEEPFLAYIGDAKLPANQRYFISIGKNETSYEPEKNFNQIYLNNSRNFKALLVQKGIQDIKYIETDDVHNELAWNKMFHEFILWINKKVY
jgi:predicted alpha/beta superfamily hydrolase